ncbi:unnamed protein product [Brassica rapa]|uniref:Uncharacterized protein n=1 Tax=Brassica campestris TaxID=3711 RepID=A0A8D9FYV1_BRACM|nr:unnamed protein product [Brassica rapa]
MLICVVSVLIYVLIGNSQRGPKSSEQSTGRASMLSPRTSVLICLLMDSHGHSHGRPVCADGHTGTHIQPRTSCVCWRTPTDVLCVLNRQPTWAKITQTVHGKGQRAESKDQRADMCTDGKPQTSCVRPVCAEGHTLTATDVLCVLTDSHRQPRTDGRSVCADGHTRTAMDYLCVLTDTHGRPVCADGHPQTPRGPKSPEQSTGRASVLSPRTSVLICLLMDSHRRPVCADGDTRTHTDTHGQPWMSCYCMCWRTPRDVLCVLKKQPTWAKITQTVPGMGQRAESKDQRADMCTDGQPRTSCVCWRTPTDVLCVLNRQPTTYTDTHGQPRTSCVC